MRQDHHKFMLRAIELAKKGLGRAAPNPIVGAVIVHQNKIIGEGYHEKYGQAHAEVNAIASIKKEDTHLLRNATIYVTLEPCAHFGKTPPCAKLIVEKQIPKVVIACLDPFPKVAGRGVEMLKKAGIEIKLGIQEEVGKHLIRRFVTFYQKKRPYIILKWAETIDGFMAPLQPQQRWISNKIAKKLSHRWRTEEAAILVGTSTANIDNPKLSSRLWPGQNPLRLVIDKNLKLPSSLHLFDQSIPTLVFTAQSKAASFNCSYQQIDFSKNIIPQILINLHRRQINSLIVEGGKQLFNSFIDLDLWDEARIFVGKQYWGEGVAAPKLKARHLKKESIGNNELIHLFKD